MPYVAFEKVLPYTGRILFDIKGMNSERHKHNTGRGNEEILENLTRFGRLDIGMTDTMPDAEPPSAETLNAMAEILQRESGIPCVIPEQP